MELIVLKWFPTNTVLVVLLWLSGSVDSQTFCTPPVLDYQSAECISTEEAINTSLVHRGCRDFIADAYVYKFISDYSCLNDLLEVLHIQFLSSAVSELCNETVRGYFCNYVYPSCLPSDVGNSVQVPFGICHEDCLQYLFGDSCQHEVVFLSSVGDLSGSFRFPLQCDNTLLFVDDLGFDRDNVELAEYRGNSSQQDDMMCVSLSDVITATEATRPPQPATTATVQVGMEQTQGFPLETVIIAVSVICTVAIFLLLVVGLVLYSRKRRTKSKGLLQALSHSSGNQSSFSNHYHHSTPPMARAEPYDDPTLFQLSMDDACLLDSPNVKKALVPFNQLKLENEIGQGAFGCVYKGLLIQKDEQGQEISIQVAVKTIKNCTGSYTELKGFIEESTLMHRFNHPNVLGLVGICLDEKNSPYLLLPFMENGDLKGFLKNKRAAGIGGDSACPEGLCEDTMLRICCEIAYGMEYLAQQKLVHRDLAARNCMVDGSLKVKVADFGLTRDIYETDYYRQHHRTRIPVKWMAPESLVDRISNQKTDVWSYGVTCWEVFSLGKTPYPTVSHVEMLEYLELGGRLKQPPLCPNSLYSLMLKCWDLLPQDRPTFSEIVSFLTTSVLHSTIVEIENVLTTPPSPLESPQDLYDQVPDENMDSLTMSPAPRLDGDDDSLFHSVISLLPPLLTEGIGDDGEKGKAASGTSPSATDYYTEISPIRKPDEAKRSSVDDYVQMSPVKKLVSQFSSPGILSKSRNGSLKRASSLSNSPTTRYSDYYTEMSPVKKPFMKATTTTALESSFLKESSFNRADENKSNSSPIKSKRRSGNGLDGKSLMKQSSVSNEYYYNEPVASKSSAHPSGQTMTVTVARNGSNVSDYWPMFPAEPANSSSEPAKPVRLGSRLKDVAKKPRC